METKTLTVRLSLDEFNKLDELVRQRRKETGDAVTKSELIREALAEFMKKRQG
jgi:predicted transcriptional regulator